MSDGPDRTSELAEAMFVPEGKSRTAGMNRADRRQYEREERRAAKRALIERIGRHL